VSAPTTAQQPVQTCSVPITLNAVGKVFRVTSQLAVTTSSSSSFAGFYIGGTLPLYAPTITSASGTGTYSVGFEFVCSLTAAGASPILSCAGTESSSVGSGGLVLTSYSAVSASGGNLTGSTLTVGSYCDFGTGSSGNGCTGANLFIEQLN
jgi:hypothetical protein